MIVAALGDLRLHATASEQHIHREIGAALDRAGIPHKHEARIAPRCRVDFLCDGGVAIEVKRGKPHTGRVAAQVARYAASPLVAAVVLVLERNLIHTPAGAHGKPVRVVALATNWGIVT
jgi:hypothetical protein